MSQVAEEHGLELQTEIPHAATASAVQEPAVADDMQSRLEALRRWAGRSSRFT